MKTDPNGIFQRAKHILLNPKMEWPVIEEENGSHIQVLSNYLIWLSLIPALCVLIGWSSDFNFAIKLAIQQIVTTIGGAYLAAWVINALAPRYNAVKNFDKAFSVVAYSYTASCVGGIFLLVNALSILSFISGLYGLYILYVGLKPMMKAPEEANGLYTIVSVLCMIGISIILGLVYKVVII